MSIIKNNSIDDFLEDSSTSKAKDRILILSAYTKNIQWNNYGRNDYAEVSERRNKQYAEANGYDFKYIELDNSDDGFWPTWVKIPAIRKYLPLYDYVCWIDADAIFAIDSPLDFLMGKDISVMKACPSPDFVNTLTMTSTGIMLIKNTDFSKNVFDNLLEQSSMWDDGSFKQGNWHEQGLLDQMYVIPQVSQTYRFDSDYYKLVNRSTEDICRYFETDNFLIFPDKFQSCDMEDIYFIFHAAAGAETKRKRLEDVCGFVRDSSLADNFLNKFNNAVEESMGELDDTIIKKVGIFIDSKSLGDNIAWIPYAEEYRKKHNCKVVLSAFWNNLFEKEYPEIEFISPGSIVNDIHGQYNIGWYFPWNSNRNPNDFRTIPLQQTASDILELDYKEVRPKITIPDKPRTIEEKYVCIGIHSTCQSKYWNYPDGWQKITDYLNEKGYKVVHISKEQGEYMGNSPPKNIIDKTGNFPIEDRMVDLKHADMFIGLGSGLSWLSWAIGTPTVMISGFSAPFCEPQEGIERPFNPNVCNSCFNDANIQFDPGDWNWCPRNKDFECSKLITPEMVINSINNIIKKDVDKLMIVAHPDDESIFGGNTLLTETGWKVICVTGSSNKARRKEFEEAMRKAGVKEYEIWDFEDGDNIVLDSSEIYVKIYDAINEKNYNKVVTHSESGEYGHIQHICVHNIVKNIVRNIATDNLYVFNSSFYSLSKEDLENKINLLRVYESQAGDDREILLNSHLYKDYIYNENIKRLGI